jgi:cell shape-determining protein MreC
MNYHQKNSFLFSSTKKSSKKRTIIFSLVLVFLILIFISSSFRNLVFLIGRPIWKLENAIETSLSDSWSLLSSKQSLVEENRALRDAKNKTDYYSLVNDFLRQENTSLKEALGRKDEKSNSVLAYVLSKPGITLYDEMIVDAGSNFNVKVGDLVSADGTIVLGEIGEVFDKTSKVVLFSTPNRVTNVLLGPNSIQAEAKGVGSGNFVVRLPKETELKEGDTVIVPSISPNVFGIVEKIVSESTDTFQNVYFKNPVNLLELKFVQIIKK